MPYLKLCYANVAQLVVQLIRNQQVGGSSPPISSSFNFAVLLGDALLYKTINYN